MSLNRLHVCYSGQVTACLAEVAEQDRDKSVQQAALNALVALGKSALACEMKASITERRRRELNVKAKQGAVWEAQQSMCEALAFTRQQRHIAMRCR
jgi:hypothetical protein